MFEQAGRLFSFGVIPALLILAHCDSELGEDARSSSDPKRDEHQPRRLP